MPMRDVFHPPMSSECPWPSHYVMWAFGLGGHLNRYVLPEAYRALPLSHFGSMGGVPDPIYGSGVEESKIWTPPDPSLGLETDFCMPDNIEIRIEKHSRQVAAILFVSPVNKERANHRQTFAAKCANLLSQGMGVVVVDVVTEHQFNLHDDLMRLLGQDHLAGAIMESPTYVVGYRSVLDQPSRLESWPTAMEVGQAFPVVPLWIGQDLPIPVDLESAYQESWASLRL